MEDLQKKKYRIAIDPGHGKDGDPGAVGPSGLKEADVTATLAAYLDNELRLAGLGTYQVDRSLLSSQRAEEAAANGSDLLISLHCNAAGSTAKGIETWFPHGNKEGEKLARSLQQILVENTQVTDRGVKDDYDWRPAVDPSWTGGMGVLRGFPGPVCLVELLFISNPEEEKKLGDRDFLVKEASFLRQGILAFLGEEALAPSPTEEDEADALFPDIPADLWGGTARAMALRLAELGVLSGYEDGAFRPQQPMTRLEGAALVYKALAVLGKVPGV
ncbi:MAG: N-acetylmuramoyl-L-alanine amidase [Coprothermobacterota bacterium]|nr:N-acetylmuramoyl-L-alanine amidase [Coprothermobacterota bacterium]